MYLFRRRASSRQRRWLSNSAILGGAAVSAAVVALLTSVLPGIEGGGEAQLASTTATAATFFPTTASTGFFLGGSTTAFDNDGGTGTTWGPSLEDSTPSMAAYDLQWTAARGTAVGELTAPGVLESIRPATGACPTGWSDTSGIDGTSITLDLLVPNRNDTASEPVRLAQGLAAYLNWVNANGGIGPGKLTVEPRLVDQPTGVAGEGPTPPFAVAVLDSQADDNAAGSLDATCIPRPLSVSRDPVADASVTPWTTPGPELSLATEARLWTELIRRELVGSPGPASTTTSAAPGAGIVALVGPSETGTLYRQAFEQAEANRPSGLPVAYITSPSELTTAPEILIMMGSPEDCRSAMAALPEQARPARLKLVAAPCVTPSQSTTLPEAAGWYSLPGGLRDATVYYYGDDAFQRLVDDELKAAGLDPADPVIRRGFGLYGWLWQQSLEIAAALPGGLTRSNLIATQRQLAGLTHPMLLDGVKLQTGPDDPWLVEGSDASVWSGSADGAWALETVVDVNGQTPPCRWEGLSRSCQPPG